MHLVEQVRALAGAQGSLFKHGLGPVDWSLQPWAVKSSSADLNLDVLENSYNRMYI